MTNRMTAGEALLTEFAELCWEHGYGFSDERARLRRKEISDELCRILSDAAAIRERMGEGWQPISTAPQTGEQFVAAARILRTGTKELLYWQTDVWRFDEGRFQTEGDPGIGFEDCEIWTSLPAYPSLPEPPQ